MKISVFALCVLASIICLFSSDTFVQGKTYYCGEYKVENVVGDHFFAGCCQEHDVCCDVQDSKYTIIAVKAGNGCLTYKDDARYANVVSKKCDMREDQRWKIDGDRIKTPNGYCLEIDPNDGCSNHANIRLDNCHSSGSGADRQKWNYGSKNTNANIYNDDYCNERKCLEGTNNDIRIAKKCNSDSDRLFKRKIGSAVKCNNDFGDCMAKRCNNMSWRNKLNGKYAICQANAGIYYGVVQAVGVCT